MDGERSDAVVHHQSEQWHVPSAHDSSEAEIQQAGELKCYQSCSSSCRLGCQITHPLLLGESARQGRRGGVGPPRSLTRPTRPQRGRLNSIFQTRSQTVTYCCTGTSGCRLVRRELADQLSQVQQRLVFESDTDTGLQLRYPFWAASEEATVLINGEPQDVSASPGSYIRLQRDWKKGDVVTLDLPLIGLLGPTPMTVTGRSVLESTRELPPGFSSEW